MLGDEHAARVVRVARVMAAPERMDMMGERFELHLTHEDADSTKVFEARRLSRCIDHWERLVWNDETLLDTYVVLNLSADRIVWQSSDAAMPDTKKAE